MRTAPVKATALPAVYRANLEFQSPVPFPEFVHTRYMFQGFTYAPTPSVLHFSAFIYACFQLRFTL